jgi:hypothetical protein
MFERLRQERRFATPRRISDVMNGQIMTPEKILEELPIEVVDKFISRNGNPKKERIDRFLRQIRKCLEAGFPAKQLLYMDEECVNNKGHIDQDRLKRIVAGEFDD